MADRATWPASAWELTATDVYDGREVKTSKRSGDTVHVTFLSGDPVDLPADSEVAVSRLISNTPLAEN